MFFKAHEEGRIGYKQLTNADLGHSASSKQTHIGLFDKILTFLPDQDFEDRAMFIFRNEGNILDVYFKRILNPDGTFRSPAIRKGDRDGTSVVTVIRDLVDNNPNCTWYLVWFGLESGMAVFYLFNNLMDDCSEIGRIIDLNKSRAHITSEDRRFNALINYLENIVDNSSETIREDLEIASQTGQVKIFRPFDVEKANKLFKETGRTGEELVAAYLDRLKVNSQIFSYNWINKSSETGLPYDFTIQELNQNIIHVDVKSTLYKFEQPMVFSGQEMQFMMSTPHYQIFRVYDMGEEEKHMRVCDEGKTYAPFINNCIDEFSHKISQKEVGIQSIKLLVPTTSEYLLFKPEIRIG